MALPSPLTLIPDLMALVAKIPAPVVNELARLIRTLGSAPDPARAIRLAAMAAASKTASEAAIRAALKKR
jgi:hypothetical protein